LSKDMQPYINIVTQLTESLDCNADEIVGVVNELNLVERWLLQECKEPIRSEALEWLSKFGYELDDGGILPICNECGESVGENEKYHEYEEDSLIVCDGCHNYYKHDIGRTG